MTVDRRVANDPWVFDDYLRRTMQALFDVSVSIERQERNQQYREGLLALIDGLTHENVFGINDGIQQIAYVYKGLVAPVDKMNVDNRAGDSKQTHNQPKSGFNPANAMGADVGDE